MLESYVTRCRVKAAALTFMRKALKQRGSPATITTDGLRSYGAALDELGCRDRQEIGRWATTGRRTAISPPSDESERCSTFDTMKSLQKFASVHANIHNLFSLDRHLIDRQTYRERRSAALAAWQVLAS